MQEHRDQALEERDALFARSQRLDRRAFLKVCGRGRRRAPRRRASRPHSFQPVRVAYAQAAASASRSASPTSPTRTSTSASSTTASCSALLRAVDDVNALDPQPDFVLYGGDLAQLGQPEELELGAQILKNLKAPVRMMVGEHDWYLDMGEQVARRCSASRRTRSTTRACTSWC